MSNILKSKLSSTAYKTADPKIITGDTGGVDLVLLGRVAFALLDNGASSGKVNDNGGYRSYAEQVKMYALFKAGKLQATAAPPGTSWHGSRLAIDTSTAPIRNMSSAQLAKYGLCKPLPKEGWHIQPIETAKMGSKCNMSLSPIDLAPALKTKFKLSDSDVSYIAKYAHASALADGLISGKKTFSADTIKYIKSLPGLSTKLGIA